MMQTLKQKANDLCCVVDYATLTGSKVVVASSGDAKCSQFIPQTMLTLSPRKKTL
jgi:hypothetical protein